MLANNSTKFLSVTKGLKPSKYCIFSYSFGLSKFILEMFSSVFPPSKSVLPQSYPTSKILIFGVSIS